MKSLSIGLYDPFFYVIILYTEYVPVGHVENTFSDLEDIRV